MHVEVFSYAWIYLGEQWIYSQAVSRGTMDISRGTMDMSRGTMDMSKRTMDMSKGTMDISSPEEWINQGIYRWITDAHPLGPDQGACMSSPQNGMILDASLHALFDKCLIGVDPDVSMCL